MQGRVRRTRRKERDSGVEPASSVGATRSKRRRIRTLVEIGLLALVTVVVVGVISGRFDIGSVVNGGPGGVEQLAPPSVRPSLPGLGTTGPRPSTAAGSTTTLADIGTYYAAVKKDPEDLRSYLKLGYAYIQNIRETGDPSDYGRAAAAFDAVLKRDPRSVEALLGKGQLASGRHEFAEAKSLAEQVLVLSPRSDRALGLIADTQTELGLYDAAVASVQQMVNLSPDLSSYSRVSYQRELRGQIGPALDAMKQAFKAGANNVENREYIRVLIGNLTWLQGDMDTAEKIYQASLAAYPGYIWAQAGLARVHAARAEWDQAIALFEDNVSRLPLPEFVISLGEIQEAAGRTDDATRSYALVGQIQRLLAANGVNTDLELALFTASHGDPVRAEELGRMAYGKQPNIKAADALAWALFKNGKLDEARRYADESLRLGTHEGQFWFHAGMIAKAQGDAEAARRYLRRALEVQPHFSPLYAPVARQALAELG